MSSTDMDHNSIISANTCAYERIADQWADTWNEENERFHLPFRTLFLNSLDGRRTILDAGCGTGRDSIYYAEKGLEVTATDIVPGFLGRIRDEGPMIAVTVMDMTRPCFAAESFDAVHLFASFLHIPHELSLQTMAGFHTMLRPGGLLFMQHVKSEKGFRSYTVENLLIDGNLAYGFCHSEEELTALARDTGFDHCRISHIDPTRKPSDTRERYGLAPLQLIAEKI